MPVAVAEPLEPELPELPEPEGLGDALPEDELPVTDADLLSDDGLLD